MWQVYGHCACLNMSTVTWLLLGGRQTFLICLILANFVLKIGLASMTGLRSAATKRINRSHIFIHEMTQQLVGLLLGTEPGAVATRLKTQLALWSRYRPQWRMGQKFQLESEA